MKTGVFSFIAGPLLLSPAAMAQQQYPYSCTWTSQVAPAAKIQFTSTNGIGGYQGALYLGCRGVLDPREGMPPSQRQDLTQIKSLAGMISNRPD